MSNVHEFLETSVIFSKYIQLLVVTWKILKCGEEKEGQLNRRLRRGYSCASMCWLAEVKALVRVMVVCSF